jgi:hypothetical protein
MLRYSFNKLLRIAGEDRILLRLRYLQRVYRRDGVAHQPPPLFGIERCVGREHAFFGAEEGVTAARRRDFAERGVGIEHLVIIDRRLLQLGVLGGRIALRPPKKICRNRA